MLVISTVAVITGFYAMPISIPWALIGNVNPGVASSLPMLSTRQTALPPVPQECKSGCDQVIAVTANNQCTLQQCCTASFETQAFECFLCVGQAIAITDYSVPQSILNELRTSCVAAGLDIPDLTLPGQGSSAGSSSSHFVSSQARPVSSTRASSASLTSQMGSLTLPLPPPPTTIVQQTFTTLPSTPTNPSPSTNSASTHKKLSWLILVVGGFFAL